MALLKRSGMMAVAVDREPTFVAGKPTVLFEAKLHDPEADFAQYDVAPDGNHFVMIQDLETSPTQIHVVLNWHQELLRLVPVK